MEIIYPNEEENYKPAKVVIDDETDNIIVVEHCVNEEQAKNYGEYLRRTNNEKH